MRSLNTYDVHVRELLEHNDMAQDSSSYSVIPPWFETGRLMTEFGKWRAVGLHSNSEDSVLASDGRLNIDRSSPMGVEFQRVPGPHLMDIAHRLLQPHLTARCDRGRSETQ